jgi:hypothetical protein
VRRSVWAQKQSFHHHVGHAESLKEAHHPNPVQGNAKEGNARGQVDLIEKSQGK